MHTYTDVDVYEKESEIFSHFKKNIGLSPHYMDLASCPKNRLGRISIPGEFSDVGVPLVLQEFLPNQLLEMLSASGMTKRFLHVRQMRPHKRSHYRLKFLNAGVKLTNKCSP